ncbi:MAG: ATP-binding protein [Burkholderiaceae bacterium]
MNGRFIERLDVVFDASGQQSGWNIQEQQWQPLKGMLTGGFKQGAHWLRIQVAPHSEPLVLRMRPAFIDSVEIFAPSLGEARAEGSIAGLEKAKAVTLEPIARLGDQHLTTQTFSKTKLNGLFEIPASDQVQTFYLRLTSVSSHLLLVEVQTLSEASAFEQNQHLVLGLYLGFLLTFAIWAIAQLYLGYDRVIAAFLIKQFADLAYVSGFTGLMGMLLSRAGLGYWADLAFSLSILVVVATGSFFHASLLSEFRPYKWAIRVLWSGIFVLPLGLVLYAVGELQLALIINTAIANLFPLVSLICALSAGVYKSKEKSPLPPSISKFQLVFTYTVFAVSLQTATLPALGLWAGQELALNAFLVHGFITSLFLLALLMSRAKQHERNRLEARSQMSLMEQEVRLLSEKRQEQGRFMAMLIHELKTPLSVIRMVLGGVGIESSLRQAAGRAVRSMTDVIERCRQAEMVEDIDLHPSKLEPIELGDLSLELIEEREISRRVRLEITKPVSITLDQTLVRVILSNLLDNANRYSPIGSPITLRIELKTQQGLDGVTLEVSNLPNPGAVPDADRVFNKYYRHASSQRETGSGLGLFLIRELSERLGGWVRYNPPRDDLLTLSFLVWLPLTITDIKTRQTN